jgi:predicted RNase H-like HicB family nuclease
MESYGGLFLRHTHLQGREDLLAYAPALDVSSCGATEEEARRNIRDAVRGFLDTSADTGTLDEILKEAGYEREGENWRASEFVSVDRRKMSLK